MSDDMFLKIMLSVVALVIMALIGVLFLFVRWVRKRKRAGVVNENRTTASGINYHWIYISPGRDSDRLEKSKCELTIEADIPFAFALEHEDGGHKLAQRLGFTKKFQTNDKEFNAKVYIASDDQLFCEKLSNSSELRKIVLHLLQGNVKSIVSGRKKLTVILDALAAGSLSLSQIEKIAEDLDIFRRQLPQAALFEQAFIKHPNLWRARMFNAVSVGLLIAGVCSYITQEYDMLNPAELFAKTACLTLLIGVFYLMLIKLAFRRSTRGYNVLIHFLCWGLAGIVLCSYSVIYWINITLDHSPSTVFEPAIIEKYETHSSRTGIHYHVKLSGLHSDTYFLQVDYTTYTQAQIGQKLRLYIHSGHLNSEWIEHYQLVSP